ncbi:T9SS C-terminal target domain-containing protein, partial [Candidatus Parcubacteria bacterium]
GAPTRDREGNTQYFKTGRMVEEANGVIRVYNASDQQVWTNYVGGSGGGSTPLTYMTGPAPAAEIVAMIESRKTTVLNNQNPYGFWQSPQTVSGGFNATYWWYDYTTTEAYNADHTSKNCYVATATGQSGAVIHDVYGSANQSFYVGWWPWDHWKGMGWNCGACPNPAGDQVFGQGGPISCLGMPITNLYRPTPSENYGRQDFQRGYIINGVIYCYDHITHFTPGWTIDGWNTTWSYVITDCYDRYGAAAGLGHATGLVNENWDGTGYRTQNYDGGIYGPIMLVYNPNGPSEAYGVSGSFLYAYTMAVQGNGVRISSRIGAPTEAFSGNRQQFQYGYMTINYGTNVTYVYLNDNTEIWNSQTGLTTVAFQAGPPSGISALMESRKTTPLNNKNPYGFWQSPLTVSGGFGGTYWWYDYSITPAHQSDGTSRNCYVSIGTGQPGGVVYDVSGGARQAFYVGWWFWDHWQHMALNCGDCPTPAGTQVPSQGGPYSHLGMPITNLYRPTPSENYGRQDFQRGYIINGVIYCYDHITHFTPGWALSGWNNLWSYVITDCYDRYGAAAGLGHATQLVNTNWDSTGYITQNYDGGIFGPIMLVYNPNGSSEAYGVSGSFLYAYTMGLDGNGVRLSTRIGSPTEAFSGNRQQFQMGYMTINYGTGVTYVYLNNNTEIWNSQTGGHLGKVAQTTLPTVFALKQNQPNPFNPATTISYSLPQATQVTLHVYNLLGQRVATLVNERQAAGEHAVSWDASQYSSGVYLYRITAGEAVQTKKMLLLK